MNRKYVGLLVFAVALAFSCDHRGNGSIVVSDGDGQNNMVDLQLQSEKAPDPPRLEHQLIRNVEQREIQSIVDRCEFYERNRDWGAYRQLLANLAIQEDYQTLETISNSSLTFRSFACEEMVKHLPADSAIRYCRRLVPGSNNWRAAFLALSHHPKNTVMPYIMEMIQNPEPAVRHACYTLCDIKEWDDLVAYARLDVDDCSAVCVPNSDEVSLGVKASNYLRRIRGEPNLPEIEYLKQP